jgi:hypothetical protein
MNWQDTFVYAALPALDSEGGWGPLTVHRTLMRRLQHHQQHDEQHDRRH